MAGESPDVDELKWLLDLQIFVSHNGVVVGTMILVVSDTHNTGKPSRGQDCVYLFGMVCDCSYILFIYCV